MAVGDHYALTDPASLELSVQAQKQLIGLSCFRKQEGCSVLPSGNFYWLVLLSLTF